MEEQEYNFDKEYMNHTFVGIDLGVAEVEGVADRTGLDENSHLDKPWDLLHSSGAVRKAGKAGACWEADVDCERTISPTVPFTLLIRASFPGLREKGKRDTTY